MLVAKFHHYMKPSKDYVDVMIQSKGNHINKVWAHGSRNNI